MNNANIFSQFKICPRCGARSGLNAVACLHCGRAFRGRMLSSSKLSTTAIAGSQNAPGINASGAATIPVERRTLNITNVYQLKKSHFGPATMLAFVVVAILCSLPFLLHNRQIANMSRSDNTSPMIYVFADPAKKQYWATTVHPDQKAKDGYIVISQRHAIERGYKFVNAPSPYDN